MKKKTGECGVSQNTGDIALLEEMKSREGMSTVLNMCADHWIYNCCSCVCLNWKVEIFQINIYCIIFSTLCIFLFTD